MRGPEGARTRRAIIIPAVPIPKPEIVGAEGTLMCPRGALRLARGDAVRAERVKGRHQHRLT